MFRRVFEHEPGQIRFTEAYRLKARGAVLPGRPLLIEFADTRIADEPSGQARVDAWIVFNDKPAFSLPLALHNGWRDVDPSLTEPGEGNLWIGSLTPPADATEMTVWFTKTGPSGRTYYDSQYGANYHVRFAARDVQVEDATIGPAGLQVVVRGAGDVTDVAVEFDVLNEGGVHGRLPLRRGDLDADGRTLWTGAMQVNPRAVLSLAVAYSAGGRTWRDDNDRRGYPVPDPQAEVAGRATSTAATAAAGRSAPTQTSS
jgi:hypothetical protein